MEGQCPTKCSVSYKMMSARIKQEQKKMYYSKLILFDYGFKYNHQKKHSGGSYTI